MIEVEIYKLLRNKQYTPLFDKYINAETPLYCETSEGYRFSQRLDAIRKNRRPRLFTIENNDCLYNMNTWARLNNKNYEIVNVFILKKNSVNETHVECVCRECGCNWSTRFAQLKIQKIGCHKCAREARGLSTRVKFSDCVEIIENISPSVTLLYEIYKSNEKHLNCNCKICGNNWETAWDVLRDGSGCPACGLNTFKKELKSDDGTFSLSPYNIYVLRCHDVNEDFFKIGITRRDICKRFSTHLKMPYEYEIVSIVKTNKKDAIIGEQNLHKYHGGYKYSPLKRFDGYTECFSEINLELIQDLFNRIEVSNYVENLC